MTTQEAIEHFGGIKKLAQLLDVYPQAIYAWGAVPPRSKQFEIQVLSNNELRIDSELLNGLTIKSK